MGESGQAGPAPLAAGSLGTGEHPSWTDLGFQVAVWTGDGEVGRF